MSSEQLNNPQSADPTNDTPLTREQIAFAEVLAHDLARQWERQQRQLAPEQPLAPPSQSVA
jgi:hypothetical protein